MGALRGSLTALLMAVALAATTSCGSDSGAAAAEPPVDLGKLDVGSFRSAPEDYAPPQPVFVARVFQAERLGDLMPLPSEIDAGLKLNDSTDVHAFLAPSDGGHNSPMFGWVKPDGFDDLAKGFIAGFATTGETEEVGYRLSVSALMFETDVQARAAQAALAQRGPDAGASSFAQARSPSHPDANAYWIPDVQALVSFYATGKLVLVTTVQDQENVTLKVSDQGLLESLADKAITVTSEKVKSFEPTPAAKLAGTPLDPDGLLRISLRRPKGDSFMNMPGVYGAHGYLQLREDPDKTGRTFERYGVDRVVSDAGLLLRTRDAKSAKEYFDNELSDKHLVTADSPPGLPNARCQKYHGPEYGAIPYYCTVTFGRYVAQMWGEQLPEVHQRISAQYAILARNK